jgi:hypothetical protein
VYGGVKGEILVQASKYPGSRKKKTDRGNEANTRYPININIYIYIHENKLKRILLNFVASLTVNTNVQTQTRSIRRVYGLFFSRLRKTFLCERNAGS